MLSNARSTGIRQDSTLLGHCGVDDGGRSHQSGLRGFELGALFVGDGGLGQGAVDAMVSDVM